MRIEEVAEKSYVKKTTSYRNDYFQFRFYKTRPVKTEDNKIYKINKIYKVFFDKDDIKDTLVFILLLLILMLLLMTFLRNI